MTQFKINHTYEIILYLINKESHGRELETIFKVSLTKIQHILNELRNQNAIDYRTEGRNHIYFLKKNLISKSYVLNAENYKLIKLIAKYSFLQPLFSEIIENYPNLMPVLFGSYAKFTAKSDSDIDLYINCSDKKVKDAVSKLNSKLSVKIGDFDRKDLLIKEIIKNHVIIQGGEKFYECEFSRKT